jgi:hypothetical protein
MSSCAPIGGSEDPNGSNTPPWIFVSSVRGSWSSSLSMTLAVKESISDDESPLHPGLSGVMAVFDKDVDF